MRKIIRELGEYTQESIEINHLAQHYNELGKKGHTCLLLNLFSICIESKSNNDL